MPDMDWRSIESAPRTSRGILVWCPAWRNIYIVSWAVPLDEQAKPNHAAGYWAHFGRGPLREQPSHWMPLPPPPVTP